MPQNGNSLAIGIVGARRLREGLGPFVARILRDEGATIAGVCGRSIESATIAAAELKQSFGISAPAFADLASLVREARPDGIAICTPFDAHKNHLLEAGNLGVSAICEKPLVWNEGEDPALATEEILAAFAKKRRGIVLNAQWPQMLEPFFALYPEESAKEIRRFEMFLAPSGVGTAMIVDSLPHPLSMLFRIAGPGSPENISITYRLSGGFAEMDLSFVFRHARGAIDSLVHLKTETHRPRTAWFAINGKRVDREIRGPGYRFSLRAAADAKGTPRSIDTEDPMRLQIRAFLDALRGKMPFDSPEILRLHSQGLQAFVRAGKLPQG